jgi:hypothetical protein
MRFLGKLILPNVNTAQRDAIVSPEEGYLIYNTDTSLFNYYDGVQWVSISSPGNIDPGDVGGGASSMVISFASGSTKHVETTSGTYANLAHFIYAGSVEVGAITNFNVNVWITGNGSCDVRLINKANGDVLCELLGVTSQDEFNIQDMGSITNLPTTRTVIEIQARKTTGGGASKLRIGSLEIGY